MKLKNLAILASAVSLFSACTSHKPEQSAVTGWNYNDSKMGGFQVAKETEQRTGPGLVFIQGGTFTMGATQEDVMRDWNNVPRRVTVNTPTATRRWCWMARCAPAIATAGCRTR